HADNSVKEANLPLLDEEEVYEGLRDVDAVFSEPDDVGSVPSVAVHIRHLTWEEILAHPSARDIGGTELGGQQLCWAEVAASNRTRDRNASDPEADDVSHAVAVH